MTVLSTITQFCKRTNISIPLAINGSTDPEVTQLQGILEEEGNDLARRGDWQELTREATFITVASESQGDINSIATNGFDHIKPDTMWNRDTIIQITVLSAEQWQALKAIPVTGPYFQVRLRGDELIVNPTPAAGSNWAFEYISKNWLKNGTDYKQYSDQDDDVILLNNELILLGLRWRWKKEKGFDYAEDFDSYEEAVSLALGRNGIPKKLNMAGGSKERSPHVFISPGSWAL